MNKKPNILIIMVDQLNGTLFPDGPAEFLHTPHLRALSARSVRFKNNYTASPLCAPGRASFMAGQLPSRTRVYDNAAEYASDIPTYAHHLRRAGYYTCLSGKMHFVGPDQLHGFEDRLTTDIYPADFGWTPDYRKPGERIEWWYHNLGSVTDAGIAEISNQMEYDDEVAYHAKLKLFQLAREQGPEQGLGQGSEQGSEQEDQQKGEKSNRPWCLTVSFTHPHDPYVTRRKFWDLYEDCEHLDPTVAPISFEDQDPHSQRIYLANDYKNFDITPDDVRRSRQAYFANISYLDEKVGELMDVLDSCRMRENTIVVFCSDHGDMLGERGLWFKMNFFEGSSRVPLMISVPKRLAGFDMTGLVEAPVSNLDIVPTIADLAGVDLSEVLPWTDGETLIPLMRGQERTKPVHMEYAAEGSYAPLVCIREGQYKFIHCELDPPQLFDLGSDPHELNNLADDENYKDLVAAYMAKVRERWDMALFDAQVRESQARRWVVYEALRNGGYFPWDFQPLQKASERYMRNHMDLNIVEDRARFPRGE